MIIPLQMKIAAAAVVALIIGGLVMATKIMYSTVQEKNQEIAELTAEITMEREKVLEWQTTFNNLQSEYQTATVEVTRLNGVVGTLQVRHEKTKTELEDFKRRRSVVIAKPKLIEKMANKATKGVFSELHCATGGDKCGGGK